MKKITLTAIVLFAIGTSLFAQYPTSIKQLKGVSENTDYYPYLKYLVDTAGIYVPLKDFTFTPDAGCTKTVWAKTTCDVVFNISEDIENYVSLTLLPKNKQEDLVATLLYNFRPQNFFEPKEFELKETLPFTDVKETDDLHFTLSYLQTRNIIWGSSATTFSPNEIISKKDFNNFCDKSLGMNMSNTEGDFTNAELVKVFAMYFKHQIGLIKDAIKEEENKK